MANQEEPGKTKIELIDKGPARITGDFTIAGFENIRGEVFLCRCGESSNKPFCDGTHRSLEDD